jgi:large repetitive protein
MIKLYCAVLAFFFFHAGIIAQAPVISSFSPASAAVGNHVIITGTNFSNIALNNTVYFGSVKATVVAASSTSLTVSVPHGSLYQPISVTVDSLTGFSRQPFITSFGTGASFQNNSFSDTLGIAPANAVCFADFDNDGLPDMVGGVANSQVTIYKNTGSLAQFVFTAGVSYTAPALIRQVLAKDFDGDGKLDIALISTNNTVVELLRNSSSNGSISFDAPFYYSLGAENEPYSIDATDMDGNGKTDIIVGYSHSGTAFSVLRNTSSPGILSFAARTNFAFGTVPGGAGNVGSDNTIAATDIDGDGKPDVVSMSRYFPPYLIYRNTSIPGAVSFAPKVSITSNRNSSSGNGDIDMKLADIDGDGKPDIIHTFIDSAYISLYRNTSTPGTISYGTKTNFNGPLSAMQCTVNDMDGDGKPDIIVLTTVSTCVIKNKSTSGSFLLDAGVCYYGDFAYQQVTTADLDRDGKADMIISGSDINNNGRRRALVLRNQVNGPVITNAVPITADAGSVITISGQNFLNAVLVTFGGTAAASFTVLSDTVIQAVLGNGASGSISVVTAGGIAKYPGFTFLPPIPVITSFAPTAAPVGSTVIIKGKNFSFAPADNIVYFGSGRATVSACTDTTITVIAPAGCSYMPISVTIAGRRLTAYAAIPFTTTFDSYVPVFSAANFGDTVNYATEKYPLGIATADFDNDKKTDIVASVYFNTNSASVFKNTGTNGNIAFSRQKDYLTYPNSLPGESSNITRTIAIDLNGDGKPDMPYITATGDYFAVYKNTTTPDSISFTSTPIYYAGIDPVYLGYGDFDSDGRPDIAIAAATDGKISVMANTTIGDSISFAPKKDFVSGSAPQAVVIADFDNDGKPDMAAPNYVSNNVALFRNTSTRGNINFAERTTIATASGPQRIAAADLDGDGLIDLVVVNSITPKTVSVFKNISTPGNIAFAARADYAMPDFPRGLTIADLDGDGRPDILTGSTSSPATISLFKNNSTNGSIVLASRVDISKAPVPSDIFTTDLNGDGKPEIILSGESTERITILRNVIGDPVSAYTCPSSDTTSFSTAMPGTTFQWQEDSGNGFEDIHDVTDYSGTNTATLTLYHINSGWYGRRYRCLVDGNKYSNVYILKLMVRWQGTISNEWENPGNWLCGQVPDENTDVFIENGTPVTNSTVRIRSIVVRNGASVTVGAGFGFEVLH